MPTIKVKGFDGLIKALNRDIPQLRKKVIAATRETAKQTKSYVVQNVPVAFSELKSGIHAESTKNGARVVSDAPHAQPVEVGARPHWAPLKPLIEWVKLRGAQGLTRLGNVRSARRKAIGTTTAKQSASVATQLKQKAYEYSGGDSNSVNDVISVARAIQIAIARGGCKPTWYMRSSLPFARGVLHIEIEAALRGKKNSNP